MITQFLKSLTSNAISSDKRIIDSVVENCLSREDREVYLLKEPALVKDTNTYTSLSYFLMNFQDIYLGNKLSFYLFLSTQLVTFFVAICDSSEIGAVAFSIFIVIILRNIACVLLSKPIIESHNNSVRWCLIRKALDRKS
ncbi:hypothetical protein LMH73_026495 [Vibrio splendidus]|nr:hypothetical protein [Vibrio splendidus]MCC4880884.1 hypothetical protein [Vibrio splendidus]